MRRLLLSRIALSVLLAFTLLPAHTALAVFGNYYVTAYQATGIWYGGYMKNYVLQEPISPLAPGSWKVNSIWCTRYDETSWVECGWWKDPDTGTRKFFGAWRKNGVYGDTDNNPWEDAPAGTYHTFGVRWMADTTKWRFYVDGNTKLDLDNPYITSAVVAGVAEAHDSGDNNYGNFSALQYWDKNVAQWKLWTNLQKYEDTSGDNYYYSKVSNTAFYSKHY